MPAGLPAQLYTDLKGFLLATGYCEQARLKHLFIHHPLHIWRDTLPPTQASASYAEAIMAHLVGKQTREGEPALVLLCQALLAQLPNDNTKQNGKQVLTALRALDWSQVVASLPDSFLPYLNLVWARANEMALGHIDPEAVQGDNARPIRLASIYTGLYTTTVSRMAKMVNFRVVKRSEEKQLSVVDFFNQTPHLVLLGNPGSGKSTFVNFFALCMAGQLLGKAQNLKQLTHPLPDSDEPQTWEHGALLPVKIVLRDFVTHGLPEDPTAEGTISHLLDYIASRCQKDGMAEFATELQNHWAKVGGLLLLDGLDEVPNAPQRRVQLKQVIEAFSQSHPHVRMLVTSRTYAYQEQDWKLNGFEEATLALFNMAQIRQYVHQWYGQIAPQQAWREEEATTRAQQLCQRLETSENLRALAEQPLLLTLIVSLHTWRGTLPDDRHELYKDAVNLLLYQWQQPKMIQQADGSVSYEKGVIDWLKTQRKPLLDLLNELAFEVHQGDDGQKTANIPRARLLDGLYGLGLDKQFSLREIIDYLRDRAGILLEHGDGLYTFPHRTFQEYLAACYLYELEDFPQTLVELAVEEPNRWREALLLCASMGNTQSVWAMVEELLEEVEGDRIQEAWAVHLAGQLLVEAKAFEVSKKKYKRQLTTLKQRLIDEVMGGDLPATERVLGGNNLAVLGDPRFYDESGFCLPKDELLGFVEIPAGEFIMGSGEDDLEARENEKTARQVTLERFYMAQFPVTVVQFSIFIEATERKPHNSKSVQGVANHPVQYITWYEAMAYGEWLTEQLKMWSQTPAVLRDLLAQGWRITLPTEQQWEKAARGVDGRIYPWGDVIKPNKVNGRGMGIGMTSSMGCFPQGASPYGLQEMAGNVWEWTRSRYHRDVRQGKAVWEATGDDRMVLRGGGYKNELKRLKCTCRRWSYLHHFDYDHFGFRLCLTKDV